MKDNNSNRLIITFRLTFSTKTIKCCRGWLQSNTTNRDMPSTTRIEIQTQTLIWLKTLDSLPASLNKVCISKDQEKLLRPKVPSTRWTQVSTKNKNKRFTTIINPWCSNRVNSNKHKVILMSWKTRNCRECILWRSLITSILTSKCVKPILACLENMTSMLW